MKRGRSPILLEPQQGPIKWQQRFLLLIKSSIALDVEYHLICEAKNDLVFSETNPKTFAQNIVANCAEGQGRGASIVFKEGKGGLVSGEAGKI